MENFIGYSFHDVIGKPPKGHPDYKRLGKEWQPYTNGAAINHLKWVVEKGQAIAPGIYQGGIKTKDTFIRGQLVLLDYDGTMSWQDAKDNAFFKAHCIGAFTTASHQVNGEDRFRVLAVLPRPYKSAAEYDAVMDGLREYLKSEGFADDDTSMDAAQCSFGNPQAEIIWWDLDNRLPDIKPLVRERPQRSALTEQDEPIEITKKKAEFLLSYIPERDVEGTGTYPDAFDALTVLVNLFGEETYELVQEWNWIGLWDITAKIDDLLRYDVPVENQLRMGTLVELARKHVKPDELDDFEELLRQLNAMAFEQMEGEDPIELLGTCDGYTVGAVTPGIYQAGHHPTVECPLLDDGCSPDIDWLRRSLKGDGLFNLKNVSAFVTEGGEMFFVHYARTHNIKSIHLNQLVKWITKQKGYQWDVINHTLVKDKEPLSGKELNNLAVALSEEYRLNFPKIDTADSVISHANNNPFDPFQYELEQIEQNDDCEPVDITNLATRFLGTTDPLYDTMFKQWLVAYVSRIYNPGLFFRHMLVMMGKQECGKDYLAEIIAGGNTMVTKMGTDIKSDPDRDTLIRIHSKRILLFDELEKTTQKVQEGELKSFLTGTSDDFCQKWEKFNTNVLRRFSYYGSVNNDGFLTDITGNTRYWVIPVGVDQIDTRTFRQERDSIIKSAIMLMRQYEQSDIGLVDALKLSQEERDQSEQNNQQYIAESSVTDKLRSFGLDNRSTVFPGELIERLEFKGASLVDKRLQKDIKTAMITLGFEYKMPKDKNRKTIRAWVRVGTAPDLDEGQRYLDQVLRSPTF